MANWLKLMPVVLAGVLIAGPAPGQDASTPEGTERVITRLADEFEVPDSTVRGLRAQGLGFGEIAIALALARQLSGPERSLDDAIVLVVNERRAGAGWGQIALDHDLNLGRALSDVKRSDKSVAAPEPAARRAAVADRAARLGRPGWPEKLERLERVERAERPGRPERIERLIRR